MEKLNDDMKKIFHSSNKWDEATDMLTNDYKLETSKKEK